MLTSDCWRLHAHKILSTIHIHRLWFVVDLIFYSPSLRAQFSFDYIIQINQSMFVFYGMSKRCSLFFYRLHRVHAMNWSHHLDSPILIANFNNCCSWNTSTFVAEPIENHPRKQWLDFCFRFSFPFPNAHHLVADMLYTLLIPFILIDRLFDGFVQSKSTLMKTYPSIIIMYIFRYFVWNIECQIWYARRMVAMPDFLFMRRFKMSHKQFYSPFDANQIYRYDYW